MSMRRNHVASTSIRRHFGTKWPLGHLFMYVTPQSSPHRSKKQYSVSTERYSHPSMMADRPILVSAISPTFIYVEETSSYLSVQFFSALHWSPSVGKPCMSPVSFVKTTESYKICQRVIRTETGGPYYRIGPDCADRA